MQSRQWWRHWLGAGVGAGLCLSALLLLLHLLQPTAPEVVVNKPPKPQKVAQQPEPRQQPAPDPLQKGVQVRIAKVELPRPPAAKPKKKKAKKGVAPAVRAAVARVEPTVVRPTARLLAKGRVMLEHDDRDKPLPEVLGDFGRLGFSRYAAAILRSGGKLVVYDWSGTYGNLPLVELGQGGTVGMAKVADYDVERPRFLGAPYDAEIAAVLAKLKGREYPHGDLRPAFVLPRQAEYFILGAIETVLRSELYQYEALSGEYRQDGQGKLVFTIKKGRKRDRNDEVTLSSPIEINFGLIT